MKKRAFTLFEILLSLIIFSLIVGIIFRIYTDTQKSEKNLLRQQLVISETNNLLDYINELSLDYTIDYEEYFNRQMVGCSDIGNPEWNKDGSCKVFSSYGNSGSLYYCSSHGDGSKSGYNYYDLKDCIKSGYQAYHQYNYSFRDITDSTLNNWNDVFLGLGPVAIFDNTGVQALYLISKKGDHRILFRRHFLTGIDLDGDGFLTGENESLYAIQILKLKGFDAGSNHNFGDPDIFTHNGHIDTRACDAENGFGCVGPSIGGDYTGYHLPWDSNDGWVNITDSKITISDRNIEVWPIKDPYLATGEVDYQIDPYIQLTLKANVYGEISNEDIVLQTSISFKNSYFNFDQQEYTGFLQ